MKRFTFIFTGILTCLAQQANASFTEENLIAIERATGVICTAQTAANALAPDTTSQALDMIGQVAGEINTLTAYAMCDETSTLRIARIIQRISAKESWKQGLLPDTEFMSLFTREFITEFSHGVTLEAVGTLRGTLLNYFIGEGAGSVKDRIIRRAADAIAAAITKPAVDAAFLYANNHINNFRSTETAELAKTYLLGVVKTLRSEIAYQVAGEIIRQFAEEDTVKQRARMRS